MGKESDSQGLFENGMQGCEMCEIPMREVVCCRKLTRV